MLFRSSSGSHAWWVRPQGPQWLLEHAAREKPQQVPDVHVAARFDDAPAHVAAWEDRVWVFFARDNRCEVLSARAERNPASDLWFTVPRDMQLRASLPSADVTCVAATQEGAWALVGSRGELMHLRGDRWVTQAMPEDVPEAGRRTLCTVEIGRAHV